MKNDISKKETWAWLWILPVIAILSLFYVVPIVKVGLYSFTNASFFGGKFHYTLNTYGFLFSSGTFWIMLKTTLLFVIASVIFQFLLGFSISLALVDGENRKLLGTTFVRTAVLSAWVIPGVVIGIVWKLLLTGASYGILNYYIKVLTGYAIPFLSSPTWALVSIIIANVWRGTAFSMIILYGGLKQVPQELYEAAQIDGASAWKRLIHVTIPQLKQVIFINLALITIYTFNTFDMIMALTGGGPGRATEVLSIYSYDSVFERWALSQGAASAIVLLVINLIIVIFYYRTMKVGENNA